MDDLIVEFLTETSESLAALDLELVQLERNPEDRALVSSIFRLFHTIKGTCGFIGLPRLEKLAHSGEGVLGKIRDAELSATPEAVSLILACLDRIRSITHALEQSGAEPAGDDEDLVAQLNALVGNGDPQPAAIAVDEEHSASIAESAVARQSVRVNLELLEKLMTSVGELVLARNQALQILRTQKDSAFAEPLQRLNQVTAELQDRVMKTRMQPVGMVWSKLPRLVRDLARNLGKKVDLVLLGADTELDRQVLEMIRDPLTHMVRNAVDHGIETPDQRAAAGKPEAGRITLKAFHEGGHVIIEIADDGRGLPTDKISAMALRNGLVSEAELAALSLQQVQQFIFRGGFSTAGAVTRVSGRGVGMDVVRTNIEKIGGAVELRSREGAGACFTIKIPLTLAILPALVIECAGERFAIPQADVVELVQVGGSSRFALEQIGGASMLRLRGRPLPVVALRDALALEPAKAGDAEGVVLAVLTSGGIGFGILVDRALGSEEIVVKPLAPVLRHIGLYSGNTILGDGTVVTVLDPNGIAAATGQAVTAADLFAQAAARVRDGRGALLPVIMFGAGDATRRVVPLARVMRIEEIEREAIDRSANELYVLYRGERMPLIPLGAGPALSGGGRQPVLMLSDGVRSVGLAVDRISDVIETPLDIDRSAAAPGRLGTALVAGTLAEVLDADFFLAGVSAGQVDETARGVATRSRRLLLVDDSPFFRKLVAPLLAKSGYEVTTAESASRALKLCEAGKDFDVILSDIEMPGMDGFEFAEAVKRGDRWRHTPMLALGSKASADEIARGRAVGFNDYVAKFDRDGLLQALSSTMTELRGAA